MKGPQPPTLHPAQVVRVWGSLFSAFFELEVKAFISAELGSGAARRSQESFHGQSHSPPPLPPLGAHGRPQHSEEEARVQDGSASGRSLDGQSDGQSDAQSHGSRRAAASCSTAELSITLDAEISVYAWATAVAKLSNLGFDLG